jgi:phage terminase large subunit-like protein
MPTFDQGWIRNASDVLAASQGCYFDESRGQEACDFIEENCRQSKGKWAGKLIKLLDWQRDFLMRLFGWRLPDGRRRFKRFYLEVAKKNGKSTMLSGLALFLLMLDDAGPEVYLNACDRKQARIIFNESLKMVQASQDLNRELVLVDSESRIVCPANDGVLIANSAEAATKDGFNPSATIFDELHRQPDRKLWEVFEYAGVARDEPLLGSITTAGDVPDGPWYEQRVYSEQVNDGSIPDIRHLGIVYRALPEDDIDDPATWRKANPSLGATIQEDDFAAELKEAKRSPAALANFKRLRLNIVCREDKLFLAADEWDACGIEPVRDLVKLRKHAAYGGLDLASICDLAAFALIVGDAVEGYDVFMKFWLPAGNIVNLEIRDKVPYRAWAEAGYLTLTEGDVIDYDWIRREVNELCADLDMKLIAVDPYNAQQLLTTLSESDGLPVKKLIQGFLSLNAPTKELKRLVMSRKIRHGGHPILKWNSRNAVVKTDAAGNWKLDKEMSRKKIDGLASLVDAVAAAIGGDEDTGPSVYETRGLITL